MDVLIFKQRVENVKEIEATVAAIREETSRQRLEKLSRKHYTMWKVICIHLFQYSKAWTCQAYLISMPLVWWDVFIFILTLYTCSSWTC